MADNITVTSPAPIVVSVVQEGSPQVTVSTDVMGDTVVVENGAVPQNLFVQPEEPDMLAGGMWVQTFENGDWTLWIEDGT